MTHPAEHPPWGGAMMFFALGHGIAEFHGWLFTMGLLGVVGGAVTWWLARRSIQRTVAAV